MFIQLQKEQTVDNRTVWFKTYKIFLARRVKRIALAVKCVL